MSQLGTRVSSKLFELLPQQPAQNCRSNATSGYADTEPQTNIARDNAMARLQKHPTSRENVARAATASSTGTPTIVQAPLCNLTWHLPQHITLKRDTHEHGNYSHTCTMSTASADYISPTKCIYITLPLRHSMFSPYTEALFISHKTSTDTQLLPRLTTKMARKTLFRHRFCQMDYRYAGFGNRSPL